MTGGPDDINSQDPTTGEVDKSKEHQERARSAACRIREMSEGATLDRLRIKDLIEEGRQ